jgi:hypothetical protein
MSISILKKSQTVITSVQAFLNELVSSSLLHPEDWDGVSQAAKEELYRFTDKGLLLAKLVEMGLLTEYQAARINAGTTYGMILGNFRVLDRLGVGGMGVVGGAHPHAPPGGRQSFFPVRARRFPAASAIF